MSLIQQNAILVSGSLPSTHIRLLNGGEGLTIQDFSPRHGSFDASMLSPTVVALACADKGVGPIAYNLETESEIACFDTLPRGWGSSPTYSIDSFSSSDADFVAASAASGVIGVWKYEQNDAGTSTASLSLDFKPGSAHCQFLYAPAPSPCFVIQSFNHDLILYDTTTFVATSALPNCCFARGWSYRLAYNESLCSAFVTSAAQNSSFSQIDLKSMTYAIRNKDVRQYGGSDVRAMAMVDDSFRLAVAGGGGYVSLFDLRKTTYPIFFNTVAHDTVYAPPVRLTETTFATGGYSTDRTVRAWNMDTGQEEWNSFQRQDISTLVNIAQDALRTVGVGVVTVSGTSVEEFYVSDLGLENRKYLIDNLQDLSDISIHVHIRSESESESDNEEEIRLFRTYGSFLLAGGIELLSGTEFTVIAKSGFDLTEQFFNEFLLGLFPISELVTLDRIEELGDLCELLAGLGLKKHLWFVCSQAKVVSSGENASISFGLFVEMYRRFEEEFEEERMAERRDNEDEDEDSVIVLFRTALCLALFDGFRSRTDKRLSKDYRRYLKGIDLFIPYLSPAREEHLRSHPQIDLPVDDSHPLDPSHLLLAQFESFASDLEENTSGNIQLVSGFATDERDGTRCHVAALLLSFRYFQNMLRFGGEETEEFKRNRVIELEDMSPFGIRMLCHFAYTGNFINLEKGETYPIIDLLLILRLAESNQNERLINFCVACLKSIDTKSPDFLDELLTLGNVFDDVSFRGKILEAWAGQGAVAMSQLEDRLARSSEAVRLPELEVQVERLREAHLVRDSEGPAEGALVSNELIEELQDSIQVLRAELEAEREARVTAVAELITENEVLKEGLREEAKARLRLELQVATILKIVMRPPSPVRGTSPVLSPRRIPSPTRKTTTHQMWTHRGTE